MDITSFDGKYGFLSNFFEAPVTYKYTYGSAEAAYQAQKALHDDDADKFTEYTPAKAKRVGNKIEMRSDWDDVRLAFMRDIVFAKFFQHPELAELLLATGDAALIEGNDWHDTFWGVDSASGEGQNNLGKILMEVRAELKNPEVALLAGKNVWLTRFAAPELVIFDWMPLRTTFQWAAPNGETVDLHFERLYKIDHEDDEDAEEFTGISDCVWCFRGRKFLDLTFLLGETLDTLYKDRDTIRRIKAYRDGKKFFYQADRIPTFDAFDAEWDGINEFVILRDEGGVHLLGSRHGLQIPDITIYAGLKNSAPELEKILALLD